MWLAIRGGGGWLNNAPKVADRVGARCSNRGPMMKMALLSCNDPERVL